MARKASEPEVASRPLTESDLKRLPWRSIGPASMGGRIADMCFAPGNPKTYFLGYATGGVWKTTNFGTTFKPIFDQEETCSVGSIVCCDAPADWSGWDAKTSKEDRAKEGKAKILWVGTGEGNGRNSSSWGNGVYRSTDGGAKWTCVGLQDSHDIPRLAVDPRTPDTCYVAALGHLWGANETRGVYKTTDGGKTWDRILYIDENTGCCDVMVHPTEPDTVFAAMYMRRRTPHGYTSGGPEGGIYRSKDAGKTWEKLAGGLPNPTGRIGLDIYAKDPNKMIAVVEACIGGGNSIRDDRMRGGGVFRSDDGGTTWRRCSHRSPRAFYFSKVKFDPTDDQRVYMLGWTTEVSDDGGETFRGGVCDLLHADHHAILVNPTDPAHLIIGTDGGVSQSFDKGETWDFLNTMATGQFYNISLDDSDPYRIIGGLQDNGTCLGPSSTLRQTEKDDCKKVPATGATNSDWEDVFWGDGFHACFDPDDANYVYAEWQGGHITRLGLHDGSRKYCRPEAREGEPKFRFNWNSPFFVSAHDSSVLYHAGNRVFKLTEKGLKWQAISPDLTTNDPLKNATDGSVAEQYCTLVALSESTLQKGLLWAGSDDGLIHVTTDDGATWANVTPPQVAGRYVSRIQASRFHKNRAYITIDGHRSDQMDPCVLVTEDLGKTYQDITGDLPKNRCAKVIREDLSNENVLFVGTEGGVFVSIRRGTNWVKLHGKAVPTVPVDDIQLHPREKDVVLGTHGRSIWVLDDAHWLSELTPEVLQSGLHLFTTRPTRPIWFRECPWHWTHKVFRAPNAPAGVRLDYWIGNYTGDDVEVLIKDAKGVVVKKLSGSNAAGYNRVGWNLVPEEWHQLADKGEEPFDEFHVRPGKYKAEFKMGDLTASSEFEVLPRR